MPLLQALINSQYSRHAARYNGHARSWDIPSLRKKFYDGLDVADEQSVLEVGCGTGKNFHNYHPGAHHTASDISEPMLAVARDAARGKNISIERVDASRLSYSDNTFDAAFATYALGAMPHHHAALQHMQRVVKPGGHIGILDFTQNSFLDCIMRIGVVPFDFDDLLANRGDTTNVVLDEPVYVNDCRPDRRFAILRKNY